jgi:glutamate 5-kinase
LDAKSVSLPLTDVLRQEIATVATTLVVKVGSRALTHPDGRLDEQQICNLAQQIHDAMATGRRVVLVSSGAVASGMGRLGLTQRPTDLAHLQAIAAIGQSVLVEAYERCLSVHGHHAAQVLLTSEDLDHRTRYLNARNTLLKLLELGAVPIINENDTVAVDELQTTFGDNDRLAALVTNLIGAPLLVLLSDIDGLYDGDPALPESKLVPTVSRLDAAIFGLVRDKISGLSKGGMASKLNAARICTTSGENVIIAKGRSPNVLSRIIAGEPVGTLFLAQGQAWAARKRWIAFTVQPRGTLTLDAGARQAVERKRRSLLPAGVVEVAGRFEKGDVVAVVDQNGEEFARGLTNYASEDVRRIKGLKSRQIAETLGRCQYEEVIHRDNIVVTSGAEEGA